MTFQEYIDLEPKWCLLRYGRDVCWSILNREYPDGQNIRVEYTCLDCEFNNGFHKRKEET